MLTLRNDGAVSIRPVLIPVQPDSQLLLAQVPKVFNKRNAYLTYGVDAETGELWLQRFDSLGLQDGEKLIINDASHKVTGGDVSAAYLNSGDAYITWRFNDGQVAGQRISSHGTLVGRNQLLYGSYWNALQVGFKTPFVLANDKDSIFDVFTSAGFYSGGSSDSSCLFYQVVDLHSDSIATPKRLHLKNSYRVESKISATQDSIGDIYITYETINSAVIQNVLVHYQRLDHLCQPIEAPALVSRTGVYMQPDIVMADSGRFLISWWDTTSNSGKWVVMAQLMSVDGRPLDGPLKVVQEDQLRNNVGIERIRFLGGIFEFVWRAIDLPGIRSFYLRNTWKYNSWMEGVFTSQVFDAGPALSTYDTIHMQQFMPPGTAVRLQCRSADRLADLTNSEFVGPSGIDTQYYTVDGQALSEKLSMKRFIQFRAFLSTTVFGIRPELEAVSIRYSLRNVPPPNAPGPLVGIAGHHSVAISWKRDSSGSVIHYLLYRAGSSGNYANTWFRQIDGKLDGYVDEDVINGSSYFYVLTAVDTNYSESNYSNEIRAVPFHTVLYVDAAGEPVGSGSRLDPYTSIQMALSHAYWYDTVQVLSGEYYGALTIPDRVTLLGSGSRSTLLHASDTATSIHFLGRGTMRGFSIKGNFFGLAIYGGFDGPEISDNVIVQNSEGTHNSNVGVSFKGRAPILYRNLIAGFGAGVFVEGGATKPFIHNNIIIAHDVGISLINQAQCIAYNNTIRVLGDGVGIGVDPGSTLDLRNNIIIGSNSQGGTGIGYRTDPGAITTTLWYNDIWNFSQTYGDLHLKAGNIAVDPQLRNITLGDFRLSPGSPCLHSGSPDAMFSNTDGSRNDMGAFGGPGSIEPEILYTLPVILSTGNYDARAGSFLNVDLSVEQHGNLDRVRILFRYDREILTPLKVTFADSLIHGTVTSAPDGDNSISISASNLNMKDASRTNLIRILFKVSSRIPAGRKTQLTISDGALTDVNGNQIRVDEILNGICTVSPTDQDGQYVFVDQSFTDTITTGSTEHPWHTIQSAIDNSNAGDTVYVQSGIYNEQLVLRDSITVMGTGPQGVIIRPPFNLTTGIDLKQHNNVRLTQLSFEGAPTAGSFLISSKGGTQQIDHCFMKAGSGFSAIFMMDGAGDIEVSHSYIQCAAPMGFSLQGTGNLKLFGNTFESGSAGSLVLQGWGAHIGNNKFLGGGSSNSGAIEIIDSHSPILIYNNQFYSGKISGSGVLITRGDSIILQNNTFQTNAFGVRSEHASIRTSNNIFIGNASYGENLFAGSTSRYNDCIGNLDNFGASGPGEGDTSVQPRFVVGNPTDCRLQADSPCIDAGDPDPLFNDLDGSRNDQGVYGGPYADTTIFPPVLPIVSLGPSTATNDSISLPLLGEHLGGVSILQCLLTYDTSKVDFLGISAPGDGIQSSDSYSEGPKGFVNIVSHMGHIVPNSSHVLYMRFRARMRSGQTFVSISEVELKGENMGPVTGETGKSSQSILTDIKDSHPMPTATKLYQNYPNPFNPTTNITFELARASHVRLTVFSVLGQSITTLVDAWQSSGEHDLILDGTNLSSGLYFYRLTTEHEIITRPMVLIK